MEFEKEITVKYADTGVQARLKPAAVFNYFQDISTEHCYGLGISGVHLLPSNLAWVVYRYHVIIYRYPVWKERLFVKTRRHPQDRLFDLRDFRVRDESGSLLVKASSAWVLIRLDSKKPVRLSTHLPAEFLEKSDDPIENSFPGIPEQEREGRSRSFQVRMHDLDFNRHVNNTIYALWAIESAPEEILDSCLPFEIAIQYQGEAVLGDRITAYTQPLDENPRLAFVHLLYNNGRPKPITRVLTRWEKAELFP